MAVRLDKNLRATIDKVVASYNRKITRYKKLGYATPSKVSYYDIAGMSSRKNILKELKMMSSYNKKTASKALMMGKWTSGYEQSYIKEHMKTSKKALEKQIKTLMNTEYKIMGNKAGFTMGDKAMMSNLMNNLDNGNIKSDKLISALRKYKILNETDIKDYYSMDEEKKEAFKRLLYRAENPYVNPELKTNYIEMLEDLGYAHGYDQKKLKELVKKIKGMNGAEFDKLFSEDLGVRKLTNYYAILKINMGSENSLDNVDEVRDLFDNLYGNIDELIKEYRS
ncbi:MAG: hypothetical protein J6T10_28185 [Methanobrevibacter sp.]|nr:hypothetical protein [Methanobrevibacter sp.]